jgi:hypothetical protein
VLPEAVTENIITRNKGDHDNTQQSSFRADKLMPHLPSNGCRESYRCWPGRTGSPVNVAAYPIAAAECPDLAVPDEFSRRLAVRGGDDVFAGEMMSERPQNNGLTQAVVRCQYLIVGTVPHS